MKKLGSTTYTTESQSEYFKLPKDEQAEIKDIGGFVGGYLKDGKRKGDNVSYRTLLTLDIDFGRPDTLDILKDSFPGAWVVYSTHKHTSAEPRLRFVAPFSRPVSAEEYPALARKVADYIDIELFDSTTYEPSRLMYWPSTSKDGTFLFFANEGAEMDPDFWLSQYTDWKDVSEWPISTREKRLISREIKRQQDPTTKEGVVGAFCRKYNIHECIKKYLPDVYTPTDNGRYTYVNGTTTNGVATYDDKFLYSHHDSDPAHLQLLNSFDALRLHLFGDLDEKQAPGTPTNKLPSYESTINYLMQDATFKTEYLSEKAKSMGFIEEHAEDIETPKVEETSDEWLNELDMTKKGEILPTFENLILILAHDSKIAGIRLNILSNNIEAPDKGFPWKRRNKVWVDTDDAHLLVYLAQKYTNFPDRVYLNSLTAFADAHAFHPIKEYLETLPEWDGVERLETLFVDYLGTEDNEYTREAIKRLLFAAIHRVYNPGCKFDNILVLQGEQGIGKSTLIAKLGGTWFNDSVTIADTKDVKAAAEKLQGYWILEFAELKGMRDTDAATVRSFLSRQNDIYRASYGRRVTEHPRQCIFFGTTNDSGYLVDPTGSRRFWPIFTRTEEIKKSSWNLKKPEINQIWAETFLKYREELSKGEDGILELPRSCSELLEKARLEANEYDERDGIVDDYLNMRLPEKDIWDGFSIVQKRAWVTGNEGITEAYEGVRKRNFVTTIEIWTECFGKAAADFKHKDAVELGLIMRGLLWKKASKRVEGKVIKGYVRPDYEGD